MPRNRSCPAVDVHRAGLHPEGQAVSVFSHDRSDAPHRHFLRDTTHDHLRRRRHIFRSQDVLPDDLWDILPVRDLHGRRVREVPMGRRPRLGRRHAGPPGGGERRAVRQHTLSHGPRLCAALRPGQGPQRVPFGGAGQHRDELREGQHAAVPGLGLPVRGLLRQPRDWHLHAAGRHEHPGHRRVIGHRDRALHQEVSVHLADGGHGLLRGLVFQRRLPQIGLGVFGVPVHLPAAAPGLDVHGVWPQTDLLQVQGRGGEDEEQIQLCPLLVQERGEGHAGLDVQHPDPGLLRAGRAPAECPQGRWQGRPGRGHPVARGAAAREHALSLVRREHAVVGVRSRRSLLHVPVRVLQADDGVPLLAEYGARCGLFLHGPGDHLCGGCHDVLGAARAWHRCLPLHWHRGGVARKQRAEQGHTRFRHGVRHRHRTELRAEDGGVLRPVRHGLLPRQVREDTGAGRRRQGADPRNHADSRAARSQHGEGRDPGGGPGLAGQRGLWHHQAEHRADAARHFSRGSPRGPHCACRGVLGEGGAWHGEYGDSGGNGPHRRCHPCAGFRRPARHVLHCFRSHQGQRKAREATRGARRRGAVGPRRGGLQQGFQDGHPLEQPQNGAQGHDNHRGRLHYGLVPDLCVLRDVLPELLY
mmetsp:Transcript_64249/g.167054  ORF Transcript_64249/g.167054 Transcript_64249/m.167054 type:complete len:642 (+) Transcript_64249:220-2145(+)